MTCRDCLRPHYLRLCNLRDSSSKPRQKPPASRASRRFDPRRCPGRRRVGLGADRALMHPHEGGVRRPPGRSHPRVSGGPRNRHRGAVRRLAGRGGVLFAMLRDETFCLRRLNPVLAGPTAPACPEPASTRTTAGPDGGHRLGGEGAVRTARQSTGPPAQPEDSRYTPGRGAVAGSTSRPRRPALPGPRPRRIRDPHGARPGTRRRPLDPAITP